MALFEPTNLLLLGCALIYLLIGDPTDGIVLLGFVLGISLLDAGQQQRSNRALAELARLSTPRSHVRRGDQDLELTADQLLIADLLRLEEGDRLAADAEFTEGLGLQLDESLLTGESLPVGKDLPGELLLAGSLVTSGRGWASVVAVGPDTQLGKLGKNLATVQPPPTRLQRQTRRITGQLSIAALALCAALAVAQGLLSGHWAEALLAALALALALLPNEIPVVLALFLALGALRLAKIGVLARWPAAVESLGSATVLAVDKTGTLTQNQMAVQQLLTWPDQCHWQVDQPLDEPFHQLVELAVLASRRDPVDAMEQAIRKLALGELQGSEHLHPDWPLAHDYPLDAKLLAMSRLWSDPQGQRHLAAKGAPEAISDLCHLEPRRAQALRAASDYLAGQGLRVLAVAQGLGGLPLHESPQGLGDGEPPEDLHSFLFQPLGLIGLADPLRPDVPAAIASARAAGVRVVMITGDGPVTARSIATQAGLPAGEVVCGSELMGLGGPALAAKVQQISVFARVLPDQKLQLVRALQAAGEVVAMTGDGVNDAAALKAADIGVAMGKRGCAVAREAADLVLLNDNFADLVQALALGRRIDANLHRGLAYTLAIHLPIAALSLLPLLWPGLGLLLLPVHIAVLHLVIDPACTVVFEAEPARPGLMQQGPRPPEGPLFDRATWRRALGQGLSLSLVVLVLALWPQLPLELKRSQIFAVLLLCSGGLVWLNRSANSWNAATGAGLGLGLWLLVENLAPLRRLLGLERLSGSVLAISAAAALVALGLAALSMPKETKKRYR